ncbi:MAG: HAD family hydrolase [Campylobacterota bacterium]|nr:HAD family hydrolase [Campylobacterota bacterium]
MMKVVIFDMDGTLIDSQYDITRTINYIREVNHGLPPLESTSVVNMINSYKRNLSKLFYGTEQHEECDRLLFESYYYDQCIQNPTLYSGIKEMLEQLQSNGVKLSVATNGPSLFARRMIEYLKIDVYFDYIVGPDITGTPKPDPVMLHYILEKYGFEYGKHKGWMVGDNSKDMEAAQRAGLYGVFATWGFSPEGEGDFVLDSPHELFGIL